MANQKVKFAVLGCGHIGKRHAEMIVRNTEAELVALCDIKAKELLGIEKYNVPLLLMYGKFSLPSVLIASPKFTGSP